VKTSVLTIYGVGKELDHIVQFRLCIAYKNVK